MFQRVILKPSRTIWGSWALKPFLVHFSCLQEIVSSFHYLPWAPKGRSEQLLIREWKRCRDKEEQPRNDSAALGWSLVFAPRDTHNTIFELFYRTKNSNKWRWSTWWNNLHFREGEGLTVSRTREDHPETSWIHINWLQALNTN